MKNLTLRVALGAALCLGFTATANADGHTCADAEFAPAVLERWPHAPDTCLEIVERDGKKFARFEAEVVSQSPSGTYVRYTRQDGSKTPSRKVNPPDGFMAQIGGQNMAIEDLQPRQTVNVYLPEALAFPKPEPMAAAAPPPPPPPPPPEPEPEPMMPTTAGNAGWLAVMGGLFLLLGGALRFARQQQ
ncbi:MAG: hypothetical protein V2I57_03015 [Xanthomonadales bacterium]|jgi:hypothetical protein|nr:hypothetical protein [Xanthomonadales bacterium]